MSFKNLIVLCAVAAGAFVGCGHTSGTSDAHVAKAGHDHGGWWCDEHGVPEEICALCNIKLVADFKANGDWCKEHDRPNSQCFACHPEKEAEFAAQYEAKYGKQPPKPVNADEERKDSRRS